jgi:hypothetical protein
MCSIKTSFLCRDCDDLTLPGGSFPLTFTDVETPYGTKGDKRGLLVLGKNGILGF